MTWGDNFKLALQLLLLSGISLLGMLVARAYGIDVSRRMANLTFILWTVSVINLTQLFRFYSSGNFQYQFQSASEIELIGNFIIAN